MSIRRGNGNLGRTRHKPSVRRDKRPRDREIGTLRPMETKSRATLIESLDLRRVALGPWGSLVYPWWFGTTRLRFKSGRTHSLGVRTSVSRRSLFEGPGRRSAWRDPRTAQAGSPSAGQTPPRMEAE